LFALCLGCSHAAGLRAETGRGRSEKSIVERWATFRLRYGCSWCGAGYGNGSAISRAGALSRDIIALAWPDIRRPLLADENLKYRRGKVNGTYPDQGVVRPHAVLAPVAEGHWFDRLVEAGHLSALPVPPPWRSSSVNSLSFFSNNILISKLISGQA
jgi:hypothetical protein